MDRLEVGQIVNTHGVRGEVKINPWTDDASVLCGVDTLYTSDGRTLSVESVRLHKNCAVVKLRGVDDMTAAQRLKGTTVLADRDALGQLPDGVYYIADLLGMAVRTADGELGTLVDVFPTGSNDVYVVRPPSGKDILLPVIPDVVKQTNLDEGYILVELMEGLVDE